MHYDKITKTYAYYRRDCSMALVQCPNCGKNVSSKATKCPACGFELPKEVEQNLCEECGTVLPEGATECPECGCPVHLDENTKLQRVSVANVELEGIKPKTKKAIIMALIILVLAIAGYFGFTSISKGNISSQYKKDLSSAVSLMWLGGYQAESAGSLIHDVWYNTIYEKSDYTTDKYTKVGSTFNDDFNTSLLRLELSDEFTSKTKSIRSNQETVENLMKKLQNPPEDQKSAHAALMNLYDSYIDMVNLALSPSGNLSSYTTNFNNADSSFSKYYKAIQIYVEADDSK